MELVLLSIYIVMVLLQALFLFWNLRHPVAARWKSLFLIQFLSFGGALILAFHYNSLPGHGFMPGLTYLGEIVFSIGAAIVYGILLAFSLIIGHLSRRKHKK